MDNPEELRTLSLCSGYHGIERGIELAGTPVRNIAICEIEAFAAANSIAKMEAGQMVPCPVWTDLKSFPVDCIPTGSLDLITAGYPCQPFSAAGKRAGRDDPRHLWPYILDIIKSTRPVRCFFENVEGHISQGLEEVLGDLESIGYRATWGIFSATEAGAPHQRKRVFIMADSRGEEPRRLSNELREKDSEIGKFGEKKLGDAKRAGFESSIMGQREIESRGAGSWPSRPGEPQHEWEESRVVDDTVRRRYSAPEKTILSGRDSSQQTSSGKIKRQLVRAVDGNPCRVDAIANRVDRLRMIGNGVCPQTAAIAWRVLGDRLCQH